MDLADPDLENPNLPTTCDPKKLNQHHWSDLAHDLHLHQSSAAIKPNQPDLSVHIITHVTCLQSLTTLSINHIYQAFTLCFAL